MKLYLHTTTGGAEYYVTNPEGSMSYPENPPVLRTDGDELEVLSIDNIKAAGFKNIRLSLFTDNERADILNALHDMRHSLPNPEKCDYLSDEGKNFVRERRAEIDALMNKLKEII